MNQAILIVLLLSIEIIAAYVFGAEMRSSNPDGVWLHTPPADGSGSPSDAFYFGASIGLLLISFAYLAVSVSLYTWSKLKSRALFRPFYSLVASAITGLVIIVLLAKFAW